MTPQARSRAGPGSGWLCHDSKYTVSYTCPNAHCDVFGFIYVKLSIMLASMGILAFRLWI